MRSGDPRSWTASRILERVGGGGGFDLDFGGGGGRPRRELTGSSSASDSADESALSADEDSNFGSDDIPASAYAGAAGAVTAGSAVANPVGDSAELDYTGPELAHSAELDYAGDDLPELLPREAAQAPAPRGFARPGDLG